MKSSLLLIDPQNDFADPKGALFVPGSEEDMDRTAEFIERNWNELKSIHVTLDSHQLFHIANPLYWVDAKGNHPEPFTQISSKDIEAETWIPSDGFIDKALTYVRSLELTGRYPHVIWPPHCIVGEWGHGLDPKIAASLRRWVQNTSAYTSPVVDYVLKGGNPDTEHFSAIRAEVPNTDPQTEINQPLVDRLKDAEQVIVAGIAGSHCVANTVRDLADSFGSQPLIEKIVLLTDTIHPVPGCEKLQADFITEMVGRGMRTATTDTLKF